jgi:hypothetical protein
MARTTNLRWPASMLLSLACIAGLPGESSCRVPGPTLRFVRQNGNLPSIKFDTAPKSDGRGVEVGPLSESALQKLRQAKPSAAEFAEILVVYADTDDDTGLPIPMLGTYAAGAGCIRFTPRFPWSPGLTYHAKFNHRLFVSRYGTGPGDRPIEESYLQLSFSIARATGPATVVAAVYPSSDRLPENLLRVYIHFSAPMSLGNAYRNIHLLDESGSEVPKPFLVLDQEMWDRAYQRFTLLFDPGRIKRGLRSNMDLGPPLRIGGKYQLVIDAAWPDGTGAPLASSYRKDFTVGPAQRTSPDYHRWQVVPPAEGTTEPLRVMLTEALDHALLQRMITVHDAKGIRLEGTIEIGAKEMEWRFIPGNPWKPGGYEIKVDTALEDLAGNSLARVFDADLSEPRSNVWAEGRVVAIPFAVKPSVGRDNRSLARSRR